MVMMLMRMGVQLACRVAVLVEVNQVRAGKKFCILQYSSRRTAGSESAAIQYVRFIGDVLKRFKHILVPEMNMGQLIKLIRADYLVDAIGFNKIQGRPFKVSELTTRIARALEDGK